MDLSPDFLKKGLLNGDFLTRFKLLFQISLHFESETSEH
jgi:hypothetical protein